jgi:hypothetical protein
VFLRDFRPPNFPDLIIEKKINALDIMNKTWQNKRVKLNRIFKKKIIKK